MAAKKKAPLETIRELKSTHNVDSSDIKSELYAPDVPLIAELDLQIKVIEFCKAKRFDLAAQAIEVDVRMAYQVEGAA